MRHRIPYKRSNKVPKRRYVIAWVHLLRGTKGWGRKVMNKLTARQLAEELNDQFPDCLHWPELKTK